MALEMFLSLTDIEGESTDPSHLGEIVVLGWNWGLANPTATPLPPGIESAAGRGRVSFEAISIQKLVDLASPRLQNACATGFVIRQGALTTRKGGGPDFLTITLTSVVVSSVLEAAAEQLSEPTETITLAFGQVGFEYRQTFPHNLGQPVSFGWDLLTNGPF